MKTLRFLAAVIFLGVVAGAAHATGAFQGRLADGTPSATCTVTGPGIGDKGIPLYGVAIKSGDVALLVSEADTWAMLLAGLGLVGLIAGRRRR